jgi:hypothetical protein
VAFLFPKLFLSNDFDQTEQFAARLVLMPAVM